VAGPTITTDRLEAGPGESITVTGNGFPPDDPLAADLFSDPVRLGTTVAGADGRFRLVVTVPLGTSPGLHTLRVRSLVGPQFADASLLVRAPAATVRAAGTQAQVLSRTGGEFGPRAQLALALMATGLVLVGLAWNDRRPAVRRSPWSDRRRWP
jgi:hypothetical protein